MLAVSGQYTNKTNIYVRIGEGATVEDGVAAGAAGEDGVVTRAAGEDGAVARAAEEDGAATGEYSAGVGAAGEDGAAEGSETCIDPVTARISVAETLRHQSGAAGERPDRP